MRFRTLLLVFAAIELLSLTAYFYPILNTFGFVVIILAAFAFSLKRLEYGLYFVLAELVLGGKGYLFSLPISDANAISLRMGLFLAVMAVWLAKIIFCFSSPKNQRIKCGTFDAAASKVPQVDFKTSTAKTFISQTFFYAPILKNWYLLGCAIIWGLLIGFLRGNDFGNLFLDANGYFYAAMVLPFIWVFIYHKANCKLETCKDKDNSKFKHFSIVFFAATAWLAIKTLLSVYLFTHAGNNFIAANLYSFYRWARDTGVGEITWLPGNFARVFFQSHLYNITAFFLLLSMIIHSPIRAKGRIDKSRIWLLIALNTAVIIISLSRSFWVGTIGGLVVLGSFLFWQNSNAWKHLLFRYFKILFVTLLLATLLLIVTARFPLPRPSPVDLSTAAKTRLEYEAAASSRWNLLSPLWEAIKKQPIIGSGFGATVTYISNDPRVREESPTGLYTTYALEWGWLDFWLKLGIFGLFAYFYLLFQFAYQFIKNAKNKILNLAGLAILVSLSIIHFFTPYLNHPLGFGILILLLILPKYSQEIEDNPVETHRL